MKKAVAIMVAAIIAGSLASSVARCDDAGGVWLGGFLLLRIRCAAGGMTAAQRVDALQLRANDLL